MTSHAELTMRHRVVEYGGRFEAGASNYYKRKIGRAPRLDRGLHSMCSTTRSWTIIGLMQVFCFAVLPALAAAQDVFVDEAVRQQSQQILDDAEFRYFDHLDDSAGRPPYRSAKRRMSFSGGGDGNGSGSQSSGDSSAKGRSDPSSRSSQRNSDSAAENSGGETDSSSIPLGGMGAIGNVFGAIFHALAYLVLVAVCVLIVYLIVLAIMNRDGGPESISSPQLRLDLPAEEDHSPGELPADAYLAKARELAEQRHYREAIAYLLLGGMSAIERADLIRHRRGLTLRDYLRVLRGRDPHFDGFKAMIGLYEPVGFGRRVASYQTFQDALAGYEQTVTSLA